MSVSPMYNHDIAKIIWISSGYHVDIDIVHLPQSLGNLFFFLPGWFECSMFELVACRFINECRCMWAAPRRWRSSNPSSKLNLST
jgi:hypothetical protein